MRFAKLVRTVHALLLGGTATLIVAGCAVTDESHKAKQQPLQSGAAPMSAASASGVARNAAPALDAPVSPGVQRAFDDASRALRSGHTEDAERAFRALAQANPELGGPHANLGLIYRQAGKLDESAMELEQAVLRNPKQPIYFNQLGVTYRQQGKFDQARLAYEKAIALDANYPPAYLNLGILSDLYLGDSKRALELYDHYLALSPNGDATVTKWIADLKNRKLAPNTDVLKEKA
jgi:Flp pilus assembly protein TadD